MPSWLHKFFKHTTYHKRSLHRAVAKSLEAVEDRLRKEECLLEERDAKYRTPLLLAAKLGKTDVVKFLLDKGADVNATDRFGHNALHMLLLHDDTKCDLDSADALLEAGLDVNQRSKFYNTPMDIIFTIECCIFKGSARESEISSYILLLELCLKKGGDPNALGYCGQGTSLLGHAVFLPPENETSVRVVELVVRYGGDFSKPLWTNEYNLELFALDYFVPEYGDRLDYAVFSMVYCPKVLEMCSSDEFKFPAENLKEFRRLLNNGYIYYGCIQSLSDPGLSSANKKFEEFVKFVNTQDLTKKELAEVLMDVSPSNFSVLQNPLGDVERLKNATFSLFHLSRREARKCVFRNHTSRLPDTASVNNQLVYYIGPNLKIF